MNMLILLDTNVLLRLIDKHHIQHATASNAMDDLRRSDYRPAIVPQVVYEFWAVATRPLDANGLGMSGAEVQAEVAELIPSLTLLRDERTIFEIWQQLVIDHDVKGKQVHDARLAAAMLRHGISHILTFNVVDFARYSEITVVDPQRASELGTVE